MRPGPRRRDVERAVAVAAEGHRRHLAHRQVDLRVQVALGRQADHPRAAPQRDPEAPLGIDAHAVRRPAARVREERPPAGRRARLDVVVELVDAPRLRVDVVHEAIVERPVDAVRDRHAVEHRLDLEVGVDAVERARRGVLEVRHRAREQAPAPIAGGVVHAKRRVVRQREHRLGLHGAGGEPREAAAEREHEAAVPVRQCRAHVRADVDRADAARRGVEPVHGLPQDVDDEQLARRLEPDRALGERESRVEDQLRGRHAVKRISGSGGGAA